MYVDEQFSIKSKMHCPADTVDALCLYWSVQLFLFPEHVPTTAAGAFFFVYYLTFMFGLAEDVHQRWEEVSAAHPGAAEEGAQQLPGVTEAGV